MPSTKNIRQRDVVEYDDSLKANDVKRFVRLRQFANNNLYFFRGGTSEIFEYDKSKPGDALICAHHILKYYIQNTAPPSGQ